MARHARHKNDWRQRVALIGIGALGAVAVTGVAGAAGPQTTDVSFIPLAPVFKLMTNQSIAAGKTLAKVVTGGTTTVPTNATTVELNVFAHGTQAGALLIYPTGNTSGGSGQSLSWAAGGSDAMTIQENVGVKNELTFLNTSAAAAIVTATIAGYSTQVTAGDVNGSGGTAGQVLTNNGSGGASWQAASDGYASYSNLATTLTGTVQSVNSLALSTGSYLIMATVNAQLIGPATSDFLTCRIRIPTHSIDTDTSEMSSAIASGTQSLQGLTSITNTTVTLECAATSSSIKTIHTYLTAVRLGAVHGDFTS